MYKVNYTNDVLFSLEKFRNFRMQSFIERFRNSGLEDIQLMQEEFESNLENFIDLLLYQSQKYLSTGQIIENGKTYEIRKGVFHIGSYTIVMFFKKYNNKNEIIVEELYIQNRY